MNLQIRNPKARELARQVADRDGISLTDAVLKALEAEAARPPNDEDAIAFVRRLAAELRAKGEPGGRPMSKDEIDDMWGM